MSTIGPSPHFRAKHLIIIVILIKRQMSAVSTRALKELDGDAVLIHMYEQAQIP